MSATGTSGPSQRTAMVLADSGSPGFRRSLGNALLDPYRPELH